MKRDLDHLMKERGLDAILVEGKTLGNPALYYMINGAHIGGGKVVKKRGAEPILLCSPIEREEAAASGLATVNMGKYDFRSIQREQKDRLAAHVELYRRIFDDLDVRGRVGMYGTMDRGGAWVLLNALNERLDGVEIRGEFDQTLIDLARGTKEADEAARIREMGKRTGIVVDRAIQFLKSHRVQDETLIQENGSPLRIGRVREEIGRYIAEQGMEDPEGIIFSIGRDAGVPHNKGNPEDIVTLGKSIVFDIFPREAGGGYFFDMTRTFCLGYAPPEVEAAYRDVYECVEAMNASFEVGQETKYYQRKTCEFFEERGRLTIGSDSQTESGYVHSLGHGVGLAIHEEPFFSDSPTNTSVLEAGHVFTCEPGLYYPEQGFGVRLEDVIWIDPDGGAHNLTDYPKELVIDL